MRRLLPLAVLLVASVPASALAVQQAAGTLSVEGARGVLQVRATGQLVGRVDSGLLTIADLTPDDRWTPVVRGKDRTRVIRARGRNLTFRVPGGRYLLTVRGEGISLTAKGKGVLVIDPVPDTLGNAGVYSLEPDADCLGEPESCVAFGEERERVRFGPDVPAAAPTP